MYQVVYTTKLPKQDWWPQIITGPVVLDKTFSQQVLARKPIIYFDKLMHNFSSRNTVMANKHEFVYNGSCLTQNLFEYYNLGAQKRNHRYSIIYGSCVRW